MDPNALLLARGSKGYALSSNSVSSLILLVGLTCKSDFFFDALMILLAWDFYFIFMVD